MQNNNVVIRKLRAHDRDFQLEIRPNEGAGVMLFYPGTMLSPFQYGPLLDALREAGLAVAALHLVGHGMNSHRAGFTFADLLRNGLDAEAWLREAGYKHIAVCGHSQGGILTLAHAAASDGITAAFPITGILPQMPEAIQLTRFAPWAARRKKLEAAITRMAHGLPRLPVPLQAYLDPGRIFTGARRMVTSRRKARLSYPLGFLASLFVADVPERLRCPLCFFSAQNDALFTPSIIQATFNRLEAPNKRLVWLDGGGHLAVMNPGICRFAARTAATFCAGLGFPLRLTCDENALGGAPHGV